MARFRVLDGKHVGGVPEKVYGPGDVVEAPDGSVEAGFFAQDPGKFQPESQWGVGVPVADLAAAQAEVDALRRRVAELEGKPLPPPAAPPPPTGLASYGDLDHKTVADLREIAAAEEIDLGGARTKDEILVRLRAK